MNNKAKTNKILYICDPFGKTDKNLPMNDTMPKTCLFSRFDEMDFSTEGFGSEVLKDLWICLISREASLWGRREVLTGKAKFGILGDGKEVPQVAMARAFRKGDWRSGYYRDQTFMMAVGLCSIEDYFAQLYADSDNDPWSGGRQMNSHYATETISDQGEIEGHLNKYNVSADVSCTAGQMARAAGIALASKKFRNLGQLSFNKDLSNNGDEVSFCTIGDSSTSEGVFWETMNAAAVDKTPMLVAVWDDGYGISVPKDLQTVKSSISKALEGFLMDEDGQGIYIYTVPGWDYASLCSVFEKAANKAREEHVPVLVHVQELTQPQGHSTSGSHERYKSKERLQWEKEHDCIEKMIEWVLETGIATEEDVAIMRKDAKTFVREGKGRAWEAYSSPNNALRREVLEAYSDLDSDIIGGLSAELTKMMSPSHSEIVQHVRQVRIKLIQHGMGLPEKLNDLLRREEDIADRRYHTHLYSETPKAAINVDVVPAKYEGEEKLLNGYQVLNTFFDKKLAEDDRIVAFGEDVGKIGDVNQGFAGMQEKYGVERVFDMGIREWTIMGSAIGMAMRGFRPIAEIQYLDYLVYGFSALTDDLASLRYRSNGLQSAPAIIRTRGHRLEGIWHAGSPLGMMIHSLRGIHIMVPRNMVQAVGFYNTLLQSDEPGIVIECLNGYRLKEKMPSNIHEFTVPLGVPEVLKEGNDVTLVTYGTCVREAQKGIKFCEELGISVELIDVQTLLPFDLEGVILESIKKTNRVIFMDEDVPGAATAYMMQKVLEEQNGYRFLDSKPITLTAKAHRPPFGSDGDYFSKPNPENVFDSVYQLMKEADPSRF